MQKLIILILISLLAPVITLAHDADPHDDLIIRMTENGFEPREMTVTEGDEVLFINNDDVDRWPASNFHPTHTLYPEFDPLKGIPPDSSWKMTFNKVGTWRMHDHLIPHMTGTIVVLANPDQNTEEKTTTTTESETPEAETGFLSKIKIFLNRIWQKIFSQSNESVKSALLVNPKLLNEFKNQDERSKYAWLEKIAEEKNPETAWQYIKAAYDTPEGVVGNPHDMAHLVGQLIYKSYGYDGLSICEPIFAFGCYHGLMEVAFDKDRPEVYEDNLIAAQDGCQTVGMIESPTYWSCIHGMGHGIATFREYDITKSLKDCDLLHERVRTYCHDGVFMEFSISAPTNFYKQSLPIYPCDNVGEKYKSSCARSQVQVMRLRFGMVTKTIAKTCIDTKNTTIIYHCVDALGYFIAQTAGGRASKIVANCQEIEDKPSAAQCMTAAAGELIFQDYVGWRESVQEICASLSGLFQDNCFKRVEQVKQSYDRN